jgi:hypothetical protein
MIKIRYRDPNQLSPGSHAEAKRRGRSTTVYLLSGLTTQERRAALRRLRLSARMGYCPALPAGQLALALLADRIRTGVGQAGAVFRLHPAGSTVPVMVMSGGAIAFLLFSTVSIRVLPPRTSEQRPASGPAPIAAVSAPFPGASRGPGARRPGGPGQVGSDSGPVTAAQPGSAGSALFTSPAVSVPGTGAGAGSGTGSGSSGGGSQDSTGSSGGSSSQGGGSPGSGSPGSPGSGSPGGPSGSSPNGGGSSGIGTGIGSGTSTSAPPLVAVTTTEAAVSAPAVPASAPAAAPQPQPTSAASPGSGVCLDVGPLGVCLDI